MAEIGNYQIPKEFKDEDKWFRFFTKRQLLYVGAALGADTLILTVTYPLGIIGLGIFLSEIILILALIFAFVIIPTDKYMLGGGYNLSNIIIRVVIKQLPFNKKIYVKHYDECISEREN